MVSTMYVFVSFSPLSFEFGAQMHWIRPEPFIHFYLFIFFSQCGRAHPHAQIIQICWMIRTFSQLYIFGCHRQCHCMPLSIKVVYSLLLYHFWIAIREYNSNMCSGSYFSDTLPYFSFWIHIRYLNTKIERKKTYETICSSC